MTFKARYDVKEDRMLLVVQPPEQPISTMTASRRQWLSFLYRLRVGAQHLGVKLSVEKPPKAPRTRPPLDPAIAALVPDRLDTIRMRPEGDGIRVTFVAGEKTRGMLLKPDGIKQMVELVARQAAWAGWDPAAAMKRIHADMLAQQAMKKAGASK